MLDSLTMIVSPMTGAKHIINLGDVSSFFLFILCRNIFQDFRQFSINNFHRLNYILISERDEPSSRNTHQVGWKGSTGKQTCLSILPYSATLQDPRGLCVWLASLFTVILFLAKLPPATVTPVGPQQNPDSWKMF